MKRLVLFAAAAFAIANGIDVAAAAERPTYETAGFPISAPSFPDGRGTCSGGSLDPGADAGWHAGLSPSDRGLDGAQKDPRKQTANLTRAAKARQS
jgi:hypothetical protein